VSLKPLTPIRARSCGSSTGSGIEGQPITWQQDGVQYVAVSSGIGGVYSLFSGDRRLASVPAGGLLWVFALAPQ
jgi:alcohol dehydrogenase (cytochrome c)